VRCLICRGDWPGSNKNWRSGPTHPRSVVRARPGQTRRSPRFNKLPISALLPISTWWLVDHPVIQSVDPARCRHKRTLGFSLPLSAIAARESAVAKRAFMVSAREPGAATPCLWHRLSGSAPLLRRTGGFLPLERSHRAFCISVERQKLSPFQNQPAAQWHDLFPLQLMVPKDSSRWAREPVLGIDSGCRTPCSVTCDNSKHTLSPSICRRTEHTEKYIKLTNL
jgi:hypothetical protein